MRVLVTGANGHLGSALVTRLLAGGYAVRASVRSLADPARTRHVAALGPVELVEVELHRSDQLEAAMRGVDVLFHAAAVYSYAEGRDEEVLAASIEGVERALRAAAAAGVGRVVLTSSIVTLPLRRPGESPCTENDWTTDTRVAYFRAKTEAERRAWALADELGLRLVTILPGSIGGPGFARNTPTIDQLEAMMRGAFRLAVLKFNLAYVDVRDVASAHVLAAERGATGRFIVANDEAPSFARILERMHAIDPRVKRPLLTLPDFMIPALTLVDRINSRLLGTPRIATPESLATIRGRRWILSSRRARQELGWRPEVPLDESLRETMAAIRVRRARPPGRS